MIIQIAEIVTHPEVTGLAVITSSTISTMSNFLSDRSLRVHWLRKLRYSLWSKLPWSAKSAGIWPLISRTFLTSVIKVIMLALEDPLTDSFISLQCQSQQPHITGDGSLSRRLDLAVKSNVDYYFFQLSVLVHLLGSVILRQTAGSLTLLWHHKDNERTKYWVS